MKCNVKMFMDIDRYIDKIKQGINEIFPIEHLELFSFNELSIMLSGEKKIDRNF